MYMCAHAAPFCCCVTAKDQMCRITKSVVADVFSGVKMVEYVSAAGTPLPGAYSAPHTANWTKGEM